MSYKCAIFGHDYGDVELEREREEDGNEVVITVREIQRCGRCEERQVVSENKEVTTLETAAEIVSEDIEDGDGPEREGEAASPERPGEWPGETPATGGATQTVPEEATDPETDDGVILTDSDDADTETGSEGGSEGGEASADRERGEWPEETTEPAASGEPAEWPQEPAAEDTPDWDLPSEIEPHPETETTVRPAGGDVLTVPEGEFYCTECGFTTAVESSSLRAGDFCPECRKGSLVHQRD